MSLVHLPWNNTENNSYLYLRQFTWPRYILCFMITQWSKNIISITIITTNSKDKAITNKVTCPVTMSETSSCSRNATLGSKKKKKIYISQPFLQWSVFMWLNSSLWNESGIELCHLCSKVFKSRLVLCAYSFPFQPPGMCVCAQLCLTLCDPMDCHLPGSSVLGIIQARILEWAAVSSSRNLPDPGIEPASPVSPALSGRFFFFF